MKDTEEKNCAINGCFFDGPPGISELVSGVYWSMFTLQGFAGGEQGMQMQAGRWQDQHL